MFQLVRLIFIILVLHLGMTFAMALPVLILLRRRARWSGGDMTFFFVPFTIWLLCGMGGLHLHAKTLTNIASEWLPLSVAIVAAVWLRGMAGDKPWRSAASKALLAALCAVAAACCYFMPTLPT